VAAERTIELASWLEAQVGSDMPELRLGLGLLEVSTFEYGSAL
jgi:hypothetical protein